MKKHIVKNVRDINLDHIFDCGQCFRWEKQSDSSYIGRAFGKSVRMMMEYDEGSLSSGNLIIEGADEEDYRSVWRDYLDLETDYSSIKKKLSETDEVMREAISHGEGIRILKQDLWETIVSFIISQNNNIPRIKGCIENLVKLTGENGNLPTPERLAMSSIEELSSVRLGYRAEYLIKCAGTICEEGLPKNYDELLNLKGVGPKVANCIRLFGLHDLSGFPIDVWIMRAMHALYKIDENDRRGMQQFAEEKFGDLGGIAQQYLFYYARSKGIA